MAIRSARGFTLIELLVVIAILALLVAILVPSLKKARDLTRSVVCLANMRNIGSSLLQYVAERNGYYPVAAWAARTPDLEEFVQEAAGSNYDPGFAGGRNFAVALWPYYRDTGLFLCPADPARNTTNRDRRDLGFYNNPDGNCEAFDGARRQTYFANVGVFSLPFGGSAPAWSQKQIEMFNQGPVPLVLDRAMKAHGGAPGEFVWLMDNGRGRGLPEHCDSNWTGDAHSANWGGHWGAHGGFRNVAPAHPVAVNPVIPSCSTGAWETHPLPPDGGWWGWDDPDGGSNYLFFDAHAENRMGFPTLREVGCHSNP